MRWAAVAAAVWAGFAAMGSAFAQQPVVQPMDLPPASAPGLANLDLESYYQDIRPQLGENAAAIDNAIKLDPSVLSAAVSKIALSVHPQYLLSGRVPDMVESLRRDLLERAALIGLARGFVGLPQDERRASDDFAASARDLTVRNPVVSSSAFTRAVLAMRDLLLVVNPVCPVGYVRRGDECFIDRTLDQARFRSVVPIRFKGEFRCSATVMAPNAILTAAHCVTDDARRVLDRKDFAVRLAGEPTDRTIAGIEIVERKSTDDPLVAAFLDVAILRFDGAPASGIEVPQLTMLTSGGRYELVAAGYGINTISSQTPDQALLGRASLELGTADEPMRFRYQKGETEVSGICQGDSGGPIFLDPKANQPIRLIGVTLSNFPLAPGGNPTNLERCLNETFSAASLTSQVLRERLCALSVTQPAYCSSSGS